MHESTGFTEVLERHRRNGEQAIAAFQGLIAVIVIGFHVFAAVRNAGITLSALILTIAACILGACLIRSAISRRQSASPEWLTALTIIDGLLFLALILSYSAAYNLPLGTAFKAPSVAFLFVFIAIRAIRFEPTPAIVAGATITAGWATIVIWVSTTDPNITTAYDSYISGSGILLGAGIEITFALAAITAAVAYAASGAHILLSSAALSSELELAKRQAEDSLARERAVFGNTIDGFITVDQHGQIEAVNPALCSMFGHKRSHLIGQNVSMLMSEENAKGLRMAIALYLQTGENPLVGKPYESEARHAQGWSFPIDISISGFKLGDRQMFTGIIRDASERIAAVKRETTERRKFEIAVNSALDAIIIIDGQGTLLEFNPAAETIFGYKRDEVIGKPMAGFIIPERFHEAHRAGVEHFLQTGEGPVLNQRIEVEALHKEGHEFAAELAITNIDTPDGTIFIGYMRDITERKKAEELLVSARDKAEVASRAKASFLAMMSHEIRTPLNGVLGILGLLQEGRLSNEQEKLVETGQKSGRILLNVINDILDFSKLEAGKLELEPQPFHADALLDSIVSLVRFSADEKGLSLSYEMDPAVPQILVGDPDNLRQVLINLVTNAIKFTDDGSVAIAMAPAPGSSSRHYRFSVTDTGIGIPADRQHELFAEFSTIDASYSRKHGGTGLGLAICKAIVAAMGGEIGLDSKEGEGSVFWFDIPLRESNGQIAELGDDDAGLPDISGTTILLVEDNATNQLVTSNMLDRLGCLVDIAGNGEEAVESASRRTYDLILMDISMPVMDGFEATRLIREKVGRDLKIVALSAFTQEEDGGRIIPGGMDDFIAKPVSKAELARVIAKHVAPGSPARSTASTQDDALPVMCATTFDALVADMDAELRDKAIGRFRADIGRGTDRISKALEDADPAALESAAHALTGAAGMFGAKQLAALCSAICQAVRDARTEAAMEMAGRVSPAANVVLEALPAPAGADAATMDTKA